MDQELKRTLAGMSVKLDSILLWKERHEADHVHLAENAEQLRDAVFGDGTPGMMSRMQTSEARQDQQDKDLKIQSNNYQSPGFWSTVQGKFILDLLKFAIIGGIVWLLTIYKNS